MDNETMMELAKMPEMERNKMFRKRKLLEKYMREHPYKISLQSDGRYHTYLPTKPNRTHISKKTMDEIVYEHKNGQNILKVKKNLL